MATARQVGRWNPPHLPILAIPRLLDPPAFRAAGGRYWRTPSLETATPAASDVRRVKTRQECANFLRRFFRDLTLKVEFAILPDSRNLGERHIQVMVALWQREQIAPATIRSCLSFLRAGPLAWQARTGEKAAVLWAEAQGIWRHVASVQDKIWSARQVDINSVVEVIGAFNPHVSALLRLMFTLGIRRKQAIMFRRLRLRF